MPDVEDNQELEQSKLNSLRDHFDAEITESWADSVLIVSSFITGLLDSAVFNVWSCFVSMQTGKIIYPYRMILLTNIDRQHALSRPRCFWSTQEFTMAMGKIWHVHHLIRGRSIHLQSIHEMAWTPSSKHNGLLMAHSGCFDIHLRCTRRHWSCAQ